VIAIQPPPALSYAVRAGDNLSTIAARYGTTWQVIARTNHIADPDQIFPGQALTVRRGSPAFRGALSLAVLTPAAPATTADALTPAALTAAVRLGPDQLREVFRSAPASRAVYTVQPGDTLSKISARLFRNPDKWPWLYDADKRVIGASPDVLTPGEKLGETLGSKPEYGDAVAAVTRARQVAADYRAAAVTASSGAAGIVAGSGIESCIIARESGGNSQVMNSSGHYGLFQFDYSTWVSGGGSPAAFGDASVAEQQQVFDAVFAARGIEPWGPSDGC
jgi:LysM repeat protein